MKRRPAAEGDFRSFDEWEADTYRDRFEHWIERGKSESEAHTIVSAELALGNLQNGDEE